MSSKESDKEFGGTEGRLRLERRLLRKIDLKMSALFFVYIFHYIDRYNVAAARLYGFEADLRLKGQEYATILSILYVGYTIMQIPSNIFLNWIERPSLYIPGLMMLWGLISILSGTTENFIGVFLARFFLGFAEAAFLPGAVFHLSRWYKRNEMGLRTAIFFTGNIVSSAFGALIASGILTKMNRKAGVAGWRWLFYIEGGITIVIALLAMFILPDFPHNTRSLSPEERALAELRMREDLDVQSEQEEKASSFTTFVLVIKDIKVWWLSLIAFCSLVCVSYAIYFPTLTATLGFNLTTTLVLCAPPFLIAVMVGLPFAMWVFALLDFHSDVKQERCFHFVALQGLSSLGFIIALSTRHTAARYVSFFFMTQSFGALIILLAWVSNTFPKLTSRRAVALAVVSTLGQLGGIVAPFLWPKMWGPSYTNSIAICLSMAGGAIVLSLSFRQYLQGLNERLEKGKSGFKEEGVRYIL